MHVNVNSFAKYEQSFTIQQLVNHIFARIKNINAEFNFIYRNPSIVTKIAKR